MAPLVSILIPCYNSERWIAQAIESALAQRWSEKEIIVLDDGSTDRSPNVISRYDGRIRWEISPNRGSNAARNRLLELAKGQWLQYLDADDYLLPDKIIQQMEFLARRPEVDVVFGQTILEHWSERGTELELIPIPEPHDVWELLASWSLPQTGSPLWRKQAISDVGGWRRNQSCCQEHELYLRLLIAGKRFEYCSSAGSVYRQWSNETVCKRNISEVHLQRLQIEQRLEDYLSETKQLTPERLRTINMARFEIARAAWRYNPSFAGDIMRRLRKLNPDFSPRGQAAPKRYLLVLQMLGFSTAETLAAAVRVVRSLTVPRLPR